ncbi:hypothetical protein GHT06_016790 [Daphnia sinensis]|uniref:Testis-expressed sequence 264 protein n=1 Tax=Daphnia sinensis TaxID=1820382 RepID=A0AAD5PRC2_9CRUS|nr:hypothetical protein GHT06_016790 [Daphnia sinensis]
METEANDLVFCLIFLLIIFFTSVCYFLVYSGLFAPIEIRAERPSFTSLRIAYKFARGPYKNAGHLFTEAHSLIPELKTIGIYYDDPQQVNPSELRYCVGIILSEGESEPDSTHLSTCLEYGFKELVLPAVDHAVITTFPFKSTVSIFIGVARVYPKLAEYIKESKLCAHPMIEIYEDDKIIFMSPLSKQDEFYVKETQDEELTNSAAEENQEEEQELSHHEITHSNDQQEETEQSQMNGVMEDSDESSGSSFEELNHS